MKKLKITDLCSENFHITKKSPQIYLLQIDENLYEVKFKKNDESSLLIDNILTHIQQFDEQKQKGTESSYEFTYETEDFIIQTPRMAEVTKDGFPIKIQDENFALPRWGPDDHIVIDPVSKPKSLRKEQFPTRNEYRNPDVFPDFDNKIYKKDQHGSTGGGMFMGPDDSFFTQDCSCSDKKKKDDPAAPHAKYDPIFPSKKKYTGPDPDHLKKPGNSSDDKDIF